MADELVISVGARTAQVQPLSQERADDIAAYQQSEAAKITAEATAETTVKTAKPASDIVKKLQSGTALTAAELQIVVRYLALAALREARG